MNQVENKIIPNQRSNLSDRVILFGSKILMVQNVAILASYILYRLIDTTLIDPPWFKTPGPSEQTSILFFVDLVGFSLLILTFLIIGVRAKNRNHIWIATGISGWLIPRMYWQFIHKESLLPNWAYGRIRFLFNLSYEYAENTMTVYLFFLSGLIPYFILKKVKDSNKISNDLFQYFKIHFYAGALLIFPHLIITNFLLEFPPVMGITHILVIILKFYMIIYGYALFRDFYKIYKLPDKSQNP